MSSFSRMGSMDQIRNMVTRELRSAVMMRNWEMVVDRFKSLPFPEIQAVKMNKWEDTALHAAIISGASEDIVAQLIDAIKMSEEEDAIKTLSVQNESGNTPLHCAASRGSLFLCHRILSIKPSLVGARNKDGETPLFLSAMYDHREAFFYLFSAGGESILTQCRRLKDGDTILHCTIKRGYLDFSLEIMHRNSEIASLMNEKGESPLEILASTPSAFTSSTPLRWWESLLYPFIWVDEKPPRTDVGDHIVDVHSETRQIREACEVAFRLPSIIEKKKRHVRGRQIMIQLVEDDALYENLMETDMLIMDRGGRLPSMPPSGIPQSLTETKKVKKRTALLRAAKYGAIEVVKAILKKRPFAIDDETEDEKNIVLVAVKERQSTILTELMKLPIWKEERLKHATDHKGNTALHLAAKHSINKDMTMSVTHLQWEVFWFEYVMGLMPTRFLDQPNEKGKTPGMIFEEEHREIMKQSNEWVKDMSGNYIVAATLISSVTFATCYQIPGGYDGSSGIPIVGSRTPVFQMFSITALVSFCFSITSLAAFLAIYGSQNDRPGHYRRSLPLKLCLGLFSLFVSIVSMLISFCAAHTFELDPRFKKKCIPLYVVLTSLPLCFYTATQIPLYWNLLTASLSNVPVSKPVYEKEEGQEEKEEEEEEQEEREAKKKEEDERKKEEEDKKKKGGERKKKGVEIKKKEEEERKQREEEALKKKEEEERKKKEEDEGKKKEDEERKQREEEELKKKEEEGKKNEEERGREEEDEEEEDDDDEDGNKDREIRERIRMFTPFGFD